jgi:hypothetical protein
VGASLQREAVMARTPVWWLALVCVALAGCGKSEAKKLAEVQQCSAITVDATGAAECLVLQYRWKQAEALAAATAYQRQQDSAAQARADAAWRAAAERHGRELRACAADPSGQVVRCLVAAGWAEARARAADDSLWRRDAARHREQLGRCTRQRQMQAGACLQLYYKWSPERALAVDDSIRRARAPGAR